MNNHTSSPVTQSISPLRQRMIEDMTMRKFMPKTQTGYLRSVKQFAQYFGHSPHTATAEDLRRYQLHLTENGAITALRFFFQVTVGHAEVTESLTNVSAPRKLPRVLSVEEVTQLIIPANGILASNYFRH